MFEIHSATQLSSFVSLLHNFWLLHNGWFAANKAICLQGNCVKQDALALMMDPGFGYTWHGSGPGEQYCSLLPMQRQTPRHSSCAVGPTHISFLNLKHELCWKAKEISAHLSVFDIPTATAPQGIIRKAKNTSNSHSCVHTPSIPQQDFFSPLPSERALKETSKKVVRVKGLDLKRPSYIQKEILTWFPNCFFIF